MKDPENLPAVVSSSDEPCILVTELTRLDSSKVIDPRLPTTKSRFKASHHVYGNVYTSVPINSETLRDDGTDAAAKGSAFQAGGKHFNVMSGHLPISQIDIAWKRFDCKRKSTSMPASEQEFEDDLGDSDLEESDTYTKQELAGHKETKQATLEEAMLTAFYQTRDELPQQTASVPELPDKNPMMLLRFFKPASVTLHATLPLHAEFVSKPAARVQRPVEDGAAVRVKKRPRISTAETLGIPKKQLDSLIPAFRKSACNNAALAGKAIPVQPSLQHIAAPTSIIRKASDPSRLHSTNILSKGNAWS